jgi:hypothetical protein
MLFQKPANNRKPWTADDVAELKRLAAEGTTLRKIAFALGRTQASVEAKASAEKIVLVRGLA